MTSTKYTTLNYGNHHSAYALSWRRIILIIVSVILALMIFLNINYVAIQLGAGKALELYENDNKACIHTLFENHYLLRLKPKPYKRPPLKEGDYNKLIDLNDFEFTIIHEEDCKASNTFLLVLISSTPSNFKRRHAIRTTWGQRNAKVKTFFMLGAVSDPNLQKDIENENNVYKDIVQGNVIDSYRNLTYKSVMTLKYMVYHCYNVTYVLKTDDDIFVNMPLMKNYLTNDLSPFGAENFLQCHVLRHSPIFRDNTSSKWPVTEEEFPGKEYPTYCAGPYSIFSPDTAFKIYQGAQTSKYFRLEDVFLYGVAAGKYPEINHTDTRPFSLYKNYGFQLFNGTFDHINFLFGPFELNVEELAAFWNLVTNKAVPSSFYYHELSNDGISNNN